MNHTIEYLLIGAFTLTGAYLAYDYTINSSEITFTSQYDQIQSEKRKAGELLTIIDLLDNPLRIDILNTGENEIIIKKMYVDGILDEAYTINVCIKHFRCILPSQRTYLVLLSSMSQNR